MNIVVASGKGGTGKTTVAVNLALSLDSVQLIDCDVEEPNAHIFLDIDTEPRSEVTIQVPLFDKGRCTNCGLCSDMCQYQAIAVLPEDLLFFPELCHGCGGCSLVCPEGAITERDRTIGTVEGGAKDGMEFVQGTMKVGEPMATPVVRELKLLLDEGVTSILDAPPGAACPVIETLQGMDYCILVTEPTPFGLYDLKIAVDVVRKLNIPFGVVINKDGVGDDRVDEYCREEGIPVILRIPHDGRIARAYSEGVPFVSTMPGMAEDLKRMFRIIASEVEG